jgi:hypothetical protein
MADPTRPQPSPKPTGKARRQRRLPPTRATIIRLIVEASESDPTATGFTLFSPDGTVEYFDANLLRRGGGRA